MRRNVALQIMLAKIDLTRIERGNVCDNLLYSRHF